MFPIRDHNPSEKTPFVTWTLIAINIVVFLSYWPFLQTEAQVQSFFDTWGLVPVGFTEAPHTLLTSMFLHGGYLHLAGNMLFLWVFGDNLEDTLGRVGFLLFYIASGLGAAFLQIAAAPGSAVPMVGASGAIAGVMGGYLLLFPKARVDLLLIIIIVFRIIPVPAWLVLIAWFGIQIFSGYGMTPTGGGVAYWAHAGGFIAGFLLVVPAWLRLGGPAFWRRTHGHPDHPEATYQRSGIPRVNRR